ncbi:AsmA family protein [Piscinibacter sp.]|uniref:AsmA family protein n=1 Tax=Piscinibacter sp. TaxID=1903157 RepID=UPI002BD114D2|nr:AsmA family protein [Albitalea sp.]HUG24779.1 AsmA family protein [Albitalea sp.]
MDATSHTRRRRLAWLLAAIAAVVAVLALCEWRGWPFLRDPIETRLSQRLQRPVEFGDQFALRLLGSIRVRSSALRIGPPAGAAADSPLGGDLVDAKDAWLEVPYGTVIGLMRSQNDAPPRITALRFGEMNASLKRQADGRANWTLAPPNAKDPDDRRIGLPEVGELVVERGRLVLRDDLTKTHLDATVSTTEGARDAAGERAGLVIAGKGRHEDRPFSFRVTSSGVLPLAASAQRSTPVMVAVTLETGPTRLNFAGTATDIVHLQALEGTLSVSGPSLARVGDAVGLTLPTTEPFSLKGRLGKSGQQWSLKEASLNVGGSRLGGQFVFDRAPQIPLLRGELTGSRLVLADLLPAFGVPSPGTANPKPPAGKVLPQREFDLPSLRRMNADIKVRLERAELGSVFAQPLTPVQGDLTLKDGVLQVANLLARTAGGEVKGAWGVDAREKRPLWTADLRWAGVDLERWLRPRSAADKAAAREAAGRDKAPGYVSGKLGGDLKLRGRGNSTAALLGSADGTVQAWIRSGSMSHLIVEAMGIDIAEALGLMIRGDTETRLPIRCAAMHATAENGTVKPQVAIIDTPDTTLLATGEVSLSDERLALTLSARPKDVSPMTLRTPIKVQGSFAEPDVGLEPKPLGRKLVIAALLAVVHPLAALIPLFDTGDPDAGACERTLQRLRGTEAAAGAKPARAR